MNLKGQTAISTFQQQQQEITLQSVNRRLQKIQFTYVSTQKSLKDQKKINDEYRLQISRLQQKVHDLERLIKTQNQQNFMNKKEVSELRDRNQQLKRFYDDMKQKVQRIVKSGIIKQYSKSIREEQSLGVTINTPKQNKGNIRMESFSNTLTSFALQQQQNQTDIKKSNYTQKLNKSPKNKFRMDMPNQIREQIASQQIKINSAMSMVTQWARYNYRMNLTHGIKTVEKVSEGQGNEFIQICGMQEFSKYGTSYFIIKLIKSQLGNIRVGVTCEAAKTSKVDQKYSISYKLGTGEVLVDKKWRKIGRKIQNDQTLTVTVDRQAGNITFSQDEEIITQVEMINEMFNSKLYPKIQMCQRGDCLQLM